MEDVYVIILSIAIGTLGAIVYALRMVVQLDRKVSKIMDHMGLSDR